MADSRRDRRTKLNLARGNISDVTTVENVRVAYRGWNLERNLLVADSGMNSKENWKELAGPAASPGTRFSRRWMRFRSQNFSM